MEEIKIIKDKSELEGTGYLEFSLGKYQGKHWIEDVHQPRTKTLQDA